MGLNKINCVIFIYFKYNKKNFNDSIALILGVITVIVKKNIIFYVDWE